MKVLLDEYTAA